MTLAHGLFAAKPITLTVGQIDGDPEWYILGQLTIGSPKQMLQVYDKRETAIHRAAALCQRIPSVYRTDSKEIKGMT